MKNRIICTLVLLFSTIAAFSQTRPVGVPQLFGGNYYQYKGFVQIDSAILTMGKDTTFTPKHPAVVFRPMDSSFYFYNGQRWNRFLAAGSSLVTETDPTVSAVAKTISGTDTANWNTASRKRLSAVTYDSVTHIFRATLSDGTILSTTIPGGTGTGSDKYVTTGSFNSLTGDISLARSGLTTLTFNIDGRYPRRNEFLDSIAILRTALPGDSVDGNNYVQTLYFDSLTGNLSADRSGMTTLTTSMDGRYLLKTGSSGAANGITRSSGIFKLGGDITEATAINVTGYNALTIQSPDGNRNIQFYGPDLGGQFLGSFNNGSVGSSFMFDHTGFSIADLVSGENPLQVGNSNVHMSSLKGTGSRLVTATNLGKLQSLANGTNGHVLTLSGGAPTWAAPTGSTIFASNGLRLDGDTVKLAKSGFGSTLTDDVTITGLTNGKSITLSGNSVSLSSKFGVSVSGTNDSAHFSANSGLNIRGRSLSLLSGNYTIDKDATTFELPQLTANSTLTFPNRFSGGRIPLFIYNKNTSAFSWLVSGSVKEADGTAITSLTNGTFYQFMWDGTAWVRMNAGGAGGFSTLDGLTDVTITSPTTDQVLKYNGSEWVNGTAAGGGTPGGSNTQIQFNNSGSFGGSSNLTWDGSTVTATNSGTAAAQSTIKAVSGSGTESVSFGHEHNSGNNLPRVFFDYAGGHNSGFVSRMAGASQLFFGLGNNAVYGGTTGTSSGRYMGIYDYIGGGWKWGLAPDGSMYVGSSTSTYGLKATQAGQLFLNNAVDDGSSKLIVNGTARATKFYAQAAGTSNSVYPLVIHNNTATTSLFTVSEAGQLGFGNSGTPAYLQGNELRFNNAATIQAPYQATGQNLISVNSPTNAAPAAGETASLLRTQGNLVVSANNGGYINVFANPTLNQTGTASGTIWGFKYAPTVTSVLGSHYAWESTAGSMKVANGNLTVNDGDITFTRYGQTASWNGSYFNISSSLITGGGQVGLSYGGLGNIRLIGNLSWGGTIDAPDAHITRAASGTLRVHDKLYIQATGTSGSTYPFAIGNNTGTAPLFNVAEDGNVSVGDGGKLTLKKTGTNRDISFTNASSDDNVGRLQLQTNSGANTFSLLEIIPRGTGATGTRSQLSLFGTDYVADAVNHEQFALLANGTNYVLTNYKTGTGTLRPIIIDATGTVGATTKNITFNIDGSVTVPSIAATSVDEMVTIDNLGKLKKQAIPAGGSSAFSGLTAATATNTINNTDKQQTWQWNSLAGGTGLSLLSTSTAATGSTQTLVGMQLTGANATASQSTTTLTVDNSHSGTTPTNVAIQATISNGTNSNSAAIVALINGGSGIGVKSTALTNNAFSGSTTSGTTFSGTSTTGTTAMFQATSSGDGVWALCDNAGTPYTAQYGGSTATANNIQDAVKLTRLTGGTPAAGMGSRILFKASSNGGGGTDQAVLQGKWVDATLATRTSAIELQAVGNATLTTVQSLVPGNLQTTNATATTALTLPITDNTVGVLEVTCTAKSASIAGTVTGKKIVRYKKISGTLTLGTITDNLATLADGDISTATWTITTSSNQIIVQATGVASKTIDWQFVTNLVNK